MIRIGLKDSPVARTWFLRGVRWSGLGSPTPSSLSSCYTEMDTSRASSIPVRLAYTTPLLPAAALARALEAPSVMSLKLHDLEVRHAHILRLLTSSFMTLRHQCPHVLTLLHVDGLTQCIFRNPNWFLWPWSVLDGGTHCKVRCSEALSRH